MRRDTCRVAAEDLDLDLVDVLLEPRDHGRVAVDDAVHDRVEHGLGAAREQLRVAFHAPADRAEIGRPAVAHGQHEVRPDEDVDLAELDLFGLVEVGRGAQDREERVPVSLELGALVGDDRVLDRDLVEAEPLRDGHELRRRGPEHPDPGHAAGDLGQLARRVVDGLGAPDTAAVHVERGVDDAFLDGCGDVFGPRLHRDLGRRLAWHRPQAVLLRARGQAREHPSSFGHGPSCPASAAALRRAGTPGRRTSGRSARCRGRS